MGNSLLSGVSGLQAHQRMLDVTGDNLANVDTTAFKSSRISFSSLLSETLREGSKSANGGGTNPIQVGSGVGIASIDRNMTQGTLMNTGQPLDMAIEGNGYFVLNDGQKDLYTRVGAFFVDSEYYLVDPATGYRVQRIGSEGVADGFQDPTSSNIRIPYDVALPAKQTSSIAYTGNLSADDTTKASTLMSSGMQFTSDGAVISPETLLSAMDQANGLVDGDKITISGSRRDGSVVNNIFTINVGPTTNEVSSLVQYKASGVLATAATNLATLDGVSLAVGDRITFTGREADGTAVNGMYTYAAGDTLADVVAAINGAYSGSTASIVNGRLVLTDDAAGASLTCMAMTYTGSGTMPLPTGNFARVTTGGNGSTVGDLLTAIDMAYANPNNGLDNWTVASVLSGEMRLADVGTGGYSLTDMKLTCSRSDALELPEYFKYLAAGGEAVKATNIEIFDSQGIGHIVSADFVRTENKNTWDLVITSVTGDVNLVDRRIRNITFLTDGSFGGVIGGDASSFKMVFAHDPSNVRSVDVTLGTAGEFDGLAQFGGGSTAAPNGQDGYASGWLSSLTVTREGVVEGVFTNGVRREVAAIKVATFQNAAGLTAMGNNYYASSANSGSPVPTKGLSGGAGAIRGGSLEKSNVEVATEFVNLIQAQNGYQANARTIKVANEMLQELTNLIR